MTTTISYPAMRNMRRTGSEIVHALRTCARLGVPGLLLHFGTAFGDDLLCTAVLRELAKRGRKNIWMMSEHPEIFAGNSDVAKVIPVDEYFAQGLVTLGQRYRLLQYGRVDLATDRTVPPKRHLIAELCACVAIRGEIDLRPYYQVDDDAKAQASWSAGRVAIQSSGLAARYPTQNKEWYPERFRSVVKALSGVCQFVQIGSTSDPPLDGAQDLRGKTTVRQAAAVLANCRLFVGGEGFLMHLARAVECPSVIIYGGRVTPGQTGYSCNANLYSPEPCAPCWLWQPCSHERICMQHISVETVVATVRHQLAAPRQPLKVDTDLL